MYPTKDSGFNTNGLGGSELQMLGGTESWDKRCNVKKKTCWQFMVQIMTKSDTSSAI